MKSKLSLFFVLMILLAGCGSQTEETPEPIEEEKEVIKIGLNELVMKDGVVYEIIAIDKVNNIYPLNPSDEFIGVAQPLNAFVDVVLKVTNLNPNPINLLDLNHNVALTINGNALDTLVAVENEERNGFSKEEIPAKSTRYVHIISEVRKSTEVKDLTLYFMGQTGQEIKVDSIKNTLAIESIPTILESANILLDLTSYEKVESILPEDTTKDHYILESPNGDDLFVIYGELSNNSGETLDVSKDIFIKVNHTDNTERFKIYTPSEDGTGFEEVVSLPGNESRKVFIVSTASATIVSKTQIEINIMGAPFTVEID